MEPIKLSERASKQVRELVDAIERTQAQAQNYIAGLVAGMDVPEGWQLDPRRMAFVAPQAPDAADDLDAAPDANHVEG